MSKKKLPAKLDVTPKEDGPKVKAREFYYVHKKTMRLYDLKKMVVMGGLIVSDEVVKTDLPVMIVSQMLVKIKAQEFEGHD